MTRDHTSIDELLAARALGGLDEEDAALLDRQMADHGDCETCRRLEAEHAEVAGMLALALEPRPVPDGMLDRILRQEPEDAGPPLHEVGARDDARLGRWRAAFGVAAAIAVILAVVLATRPDRAAVVSGTRFLSFEGGEGQLAVAYTPGDRGLVVWGSGLPDPGTDRVYELWMIEDGTPTRGACLEPHDGAVAAFIDADMGDTEQMAVTVESSACLEAPTTDPVYTTSLD